ncbi:MAG: isoleucine--tRNA ligase [Candidatus Margulisbacteria bacterium]|nr:isoleucine--tRNA ligase [Candidatus Margulisiibacteriota bacterium]MBU1021260.1 isoleucine--tRNA ligase [Candidatus Margulisiibacteriota bacterium]MBU1729251.1 isoleucine--tRNA ligase [Candidatus Margulisiibacteriota bacterium]MBU1954924.1 isoleucine--tRNA ligase [Candidatus Margulisiibacteriota bacterium]
MNYKETLNLPKTDLPIRAKLGEVEAQLLTFWDDNSIYQKMKENRKGATKFILHDGPPYPNGDIHLGHALNKILKDIVVKYKAMSGFLSPYLPGWDCHGLPIETQLIKELGDKRRELGVVEFRKKCRDYALKYVDLQLSEFKKLGVLGDWEAPYLTIEHGYEERIVELFGILAEKGYIYRGLKPIHWCPKCETALAEAEIEYEDEKSPSIYVKFKVKKVDIAEPKLKQVVDALNDNTYFVIWTTTPWTLPANVAIALHPEHEYVLAKFGEEVFIVVEDLLNDFAEKMEAKKFHILAKTKGRNLEGIVCQHPFMDRDSIVVLDDYVTLEQGTGCVHIAPGHGAEDFQVGLKYKLPVIMPVDEKGYFTSEAGDLEGKYYDESNKIITTRMKENGTLISLSFMKHSYPHCWRCKKPVIFRATEQWFISVDKDNLREKALAEIQKTKWYPGWGETRIRGMVESRPDWCISRQRSWGVPIPAFYCVACGKPHMTGKFNEAIRKLIMERGTNGWFEKETSEILPAGTKCECGGTQFKKETDILDVWFESGASHFAVIKDEPEFAWPADLYLEGSDQHRGWFQTSLLTSTAAFNQAPFKAVLTHGFTIDEKGKKMSKSLGNVVSPQDVVKNMGADVLRLWVASADFRNDMSASPDILKRIREAYTKIRNTCRFLISNLSDFQKPLKYNDLLEVDKWILLKLAKLIDRVQKAYETFEFHVVYHSIYDFCVNDLSSFYLDLSKDRLYCDAKDSKPRASAQTAIAEILMTIIKLVAPITTFMSEDLLRYMKELDCYKNNAPESILLVDFPNAPKEYLNDKLAENWDRLLDIREEIYRVIEVARKNKDIGGSLDAQVELFVEKDTKVFLESFKDMLPLVFICSSVVLSDAKATPTEAVKSEKIKNLGIIVKKAPGKKCVRCWNWRETVGSNATHPELCARCVQVVK